MHIYIIHVYMYIFIIYIYIYLYLQCQVRVARVGCHNHLALRLVGARGLDHLRDIQTQ